MTPTFSGTFTGIPRQELDLAATITSGQVFRWTCHSGEDSWSGHIEGGHQLRLSQEGGDRADTISWEIRGDIADITAARSAVRRFLRLDDLALAASAESWSGVDPLFASAWRSQSGVRVLRQDPEECFFSFLCASVAPIARIGSMLKNVSESCAGDPFGPFPTAVKIDAAGEETLRQLGLGFRAKRVAEAAHRVAHELPAGFFRSLRDIPVDAAKRELTGFFGVGEKIADCVGLFSLDHDGAIPVDTHILRIARTSYLPDLADTSLTPITYTRIGEAFRDRFGTHAGWAQQTLFYRAAVGSRAK